jgi:hypothetical protein
LGLENDATAAGTGRRDWDRLGTGGDLAAGRAHPPAAAHAVLAAHDLVRRAQPLDHVAFVHDLDVGHRAGFPQPALAASHGGASARCWRHACAADATDAGADAQERALALGPLHEPAMLAQGPDGGDAAHHPMGAGHIERQAEGLGAVRQVRAQGRNAAASQLGWQRDGLAAVSDRLKGALVGSRSCTIGVRLFDNRSRCRRDLRTCCCEFRKGSARCRRPEG